MERITRISIGNGREVMGYSRERDRGIEAMKGIDYG